MSLLGLRKDTTSGGTLLQQAEMSLSLNDTGSTLHFSSDGASWTYDHKTHFLGWMYLCLRHESMSTQLEIRDVTGNVVGQGPLGFWNYDQPLFLGSSTDPIVADLSDLRLYSRYLVAAELSDLATGSFASCQDLSMWFPLSGTITDATGHFTLISSGVFVPKGSASSESHSFSYGFHLSDPCSDNPCGSGICFNQNDAAVCDCPIDTFGPFCYSMFSKHISITNFTFS